MTFGSALAELPVCVGSAPRGTPSPASPLPTFPTSSLSARQRKRTLPAPSSLPRGCTRAHGSTRPALRGRTPAEESLDFFLDPRNRLRESLERDRVERRKGSTETVQKRCLGSETHDDLRLGHSALPQPRLAPLFVPGMVPDGPAAAVLPCTPHRHAVIRCTRGPFEGRFFFVNKGQKGDIFGGGKDRREVTMYVEHAGLSVTHAQVVEETGDGDRRREDSLALLDLNSDTGTWARVRWDRPTPLFSLSGSAASRSSCPLKGQCGDTGGSSADASSGSSLPRGSSPSSGSFSPFPSVAYSSPACKESTGVSKRQSAEQGACLPASPPVEVCGPSQFLLFQGTLLRLCRGPPLSPWGAFVEFLKAFELSHLRDIIIRALQRQCRCSQEHPKREQAPPVSPCSDTAVPYGIGSAFLGRPWSLQSDQGKGFLPTTPENQNPFSSSVVLSGRPEAAPCDSWPGGREENATDSDLSSASASVSGPLSTFRTQGGFCPRCMRSPLDRLAEASPSCLFASLQSSNRGKAKICREGSDQSAEVESAATSSPPLSSPFSTPAFPFVSRLPSARASAPSLPTPSSPSLHADPAQASSSVHRSLSTVAGSRKGAVGDQRTPEEGKACHDEQAGDEELTYEDLLKWKLACKNLPHYLPVEVKSRPLLIVDHASGTLLGQVSWTGACLFPAFRSDFPILSSSVCTSSSSGASESFLSRSTTSCPASRCSSASKYAAFFSSPSQVGTKADHTDEVASHMPLERSRGSHAAAPGAHDCGKQTPRFSLQSSPSKRHSCSGTSDAFDTLYPAAWLSSGKKTHREKREGSGDRRKREDNDNRNKKQESDDGRPRADRNDRRSVEAGSMKGDWCATTATRETKTGRDGRGEHVSQTSEKPNIQETRIVSVPSDKRNTASARGEDRASEAEGILLQRGAESLGGHPEPQGTKACGMSSLRSSLSPLLTHSEDSHHFREAASLHALSPEKKGQRSADLDVLKPGRDRAFSARKNLHLATGRDRGGGEGGAEKEEKEQTRKQHRRVPEEEGRDFEEGNMSGISGMMSGIEKMPVARTHSEGRPTLPASQSDLPSSSSFSAFSYSSVASGQSPTCRSPFPQLSPGRGPQLHLSVVDKDRRGGSILLCADSLSLSTSPAVAQPTPAASLSREVLRSPVVASTHDAGTVLSASSAFVSSSPCSALSSFSSEVAPVSLRSPALTPRPKSFLSALGRCRPHSLSASEERETRAFLLPFPSTEERRTDPREEGKPLSPALSLRASKTPLLPQKRGDGVRTEDAKPEDETERGSEEASQGGQGGEREGRTQRYGKEESERVQKEQSLAGEETREGVRDKGQGKRTEDTGADADRDRRSGAKEDEESTARGRGRMRNQEGKLGTPDSVRKRQRRSVSLLQKYVFSRNGNASHWLSFTDCSEANKVHLDAPSSLRKQVISGPYGFRVSSPSYGFRVSSPSSFPAGQGRVRERRGSSVCTLSSSLGPVFQSSVSTSSSSLGSNGQSASPFVLPVTRSSSPSSPLSFGVRQAQTASAERAALTQTESKSFGLQSPSTRVCSLRRRIRDEERGGDSEQEGAVMDTLARGTGRETEWSRTLVVKVTEEEVVFSGIVKPPEAPMCSSLVAPRPGQPRDADENIKEEEDMRNQRSGRKDGDAREECQEEQGERQMVHTPWHGSPPALLMLERRSRSEGDRKKRETFGEKPVAQRPWVSSSSAVSRSSAASPLSRAAFETVRGPIRDGQQGAREARQLQREKRGDLRSGGKEEFDREMMQRGGVGTTTTEVVCDRRTASEGSQRCAVSPKLLGGDTVSSSPEALTPSWIPFVSSEPHRASSPASSAALRLGASRRVSAASLPHAAPASQLCPEPLGSEREKVGDGWGREERRVHARPDKKRDEGDEEEAEGVGEGQTQEGTGVDRKRGGDAEAKRDEGSVITRGKKSALRRDAESKEIHSCRLASLRTDNADVVELEDRNRFSSVYQKTFSRQRKARLPSHSRFVSSSFSALPPECPDSLHASPSATPPRRTAFPRFLVSPGALGKCGSSPVSSSSSARRASAESIKKERRRLFPFLYDKRDKKSRRKRVWRRDENYEEKEEANEGNHDKKEEREEENGDQEEKKDETEKASELEAKTERREQRGREELQGLQEPERDQKTEEANGEEKSSGGEEVVKHGKTRRVVETSAGSVGLTELKASANRSLLEAEAPQTEQGRYEEATVQCARRLSRNENQRGQKVMGRRLVMEDEEEGSIPSEVVFFDLCDGDNRDSNAGAPALRELRAGCLASVLPSPSTCLPTPPFPAPFSPRASSPPSPLLLSGLAGGSGSDLGEQTSPDGDAQRGDCRLPRLEEGVCTRLKRLRNENTCEHESEKGEGREDEERGEKSGRREERKAERALREKGTRKERETHVVEGDEATSSGAPPGVLLPHFEALWFDADVAEEGRGGDTEETFLSPRFPPAEVMKNKQRMHAEVAPLKASGPSSALRAPECEGNDVLSVGASLSLFSPVASSVAVSSFSASSLHCMRSSSSDAQPNGRSERRRGAGMKAKARETKPRFCAFSRFPLSRFLVNAEKNERKLSAQEEKQECETDEGRDEAAGSDRAPEGSIARASSSDDEFLCPDSVDIRVPAFQVSRRRIASKGQGDEEGQGAERKEETDGAGRYEATRQRSEVEDVDARSRGEGEISDQEKRHLGEERREKEGHDSKKGKESDTGERVAGGGDMEGLQKRQEERTLSTETQGEERHRLAAGLAPVLLSSLLSHLVASRRQIFQELRIFCSSPPAALPSVLPSPSSHRRGVSVPASFSSPVSSAPRPFLSSGLSSSPPSSSSCLLLSSFSSLSDSSARNSSSFHLSSLAVPSDIFHVHGSGEPERPREVREPASPEGDEKRQKITCDDGEAETVTENRTSSSCCEALRETDDATGSMLGDRGAPMKSRLSLDTCFIATDRFDSKPGVAGERSRLSSSTLCSNPKQETANVCMGSNRDSTPNAEAQAKFETYQKRPDPGKSLPDRSNNCVSYDVSACTRESLGTSIRYVETRSDTGHQLKVNEGTLCIPKSEDERDDSDVGDSASPFPLSVSERQAVASDPQSSLLIDSSSVHTALPAVLPKAFCSATFHDLCSASGLRKPSRRLGKSSRNAGDGLPRSDVPDCAVNTAFGATGSAGSETRHPEGGQGRSPKLSRNSSPSVHSPHCLRKVEGDRRPPAAIWRVANSDYWSFFKKKRSVEGDSSASVTSLAATSHGNQTQKLLSWELQKKARSGDNSPAGPGGAPRVGCVLTPSATAVVKGKSRAPGTEWNPAARQARDKAQNRSDDLTSFLFGEEDDEVVLHKTKQHLLRHPREDRPVIFVPVSASGGTSRRSPFCPASPVGPPAGLSRLPADSRPYPFLPSFSRASPALDLCQMRHDASENRRASLLTNSREELSEVETPVWRAASLGAQTRLAPSPLLSPRSTSSFSPFFLPSFSPSFSPSPPFLSHPFPTSLSSFRSGSAFSPSVCPSPPFALSSSPTASIPPPSFESPACSSPVSSAPSPRFSHSSPACFGTSPSTFHGILVLFLEGTFQLVSTARGLQEGQAESFVSLPPATPLSLRPDAAFRLGNLDLAFLRFNVGCRSERGLRPTMEDEEVIIQDLGISDAFSCSFFGVYDGHGGRDCAEFVKQHLHQAFHQQLEQLCGRLDFSQRINFHIFRALYFAFLLTDAAYLRRQRSWNRVSQTPDSLACRGILGSSPGEGTGVTCVSGAVPRPRKKLMNTLISEGSPLHAPGASFVPRESPKTHLFLSPRAQPRPSSSGCASVVVVVVGGAVWCANCGDARAVLSRNGRAVDLSSDHKPDRKDEVKRIVQAGGFIRCRRVLGRLAVSRAFGDLEYKGSLYEEEDEPAELREQAREQGGTRQTKRVGKRISLFGYCEKSERERECERKLRGDAELHRSGEPPDEDGPVFFQEAGKRIYLGRKHDHVDFFFASPTVQSSVLFPSAERTRRSEPKALLAKREKKIYREPLVIAAPEIRRIALTPSDEFLLLACDGLFDVFSSDEAVAFIRRRLSAMPPYEQDPQQVVTELVREAIHERRSRDNVTAILVVFSPYVGRGGP
ncbi:protein phosphatase 2C domain-containing protein [Toxoplasma gondii ARI]|uniref:protein-serine/threonine phosphatase n=1 Tax=Toxoplasma gondii ARI TaxID=1074872 RepID=A0A139Y560_TOXGO|nr:protein phosphatase 2C domain-containing protein [Toxoplasma gondii ARI]